jgi:hypothetical protein
MIIYYNIPSGKEEPEHSKGKGDRKMKIKWTAYNNSSYLRGYRTAKTLKTAVRDAKRYVRGELMGQGTIYYYEDMGNDTHAADCQGVCGNNCYTSRDSKPIRIDII